MTGPILNPHRNCEFEKRKEALGKEGPQNLLSKISELIGEPVKIVIVSAVCTNQPHADPVTGQGLHRLVALVGEGEIHEVRSLVLELLAMVDAQAARAPRVIRA